MVGDDKKFADNIDKCDLEKMGLLALKQSLLYDNTEVFDILMKKGAPVASVLYECAYEGNTQHINYLLKAKEFKNSELAQACGLAIIAGHAEVITTILTSHPEQTKNSNYFYKTAANNTPEMSKLLDIFCKPRSTDNKSKIIAKHLH